MRSVNVWGVGIGKGLRVLTLVALLALGLSACGGSDDGGASDEQGVEAAIETALTSSDPSACAGSRTIAFMEETTSKDGTAAERECEQSVKTRDGLPDAVTVSKIEIDGEEASAEVAIEGGDGDGMVLEVALVEEDGNWKIDDFTGLVRLDRDRLISRIVGEIEKQGVGTQAEIACFSEALGELPKSEFERVVLDDGEEVVTELSEDCEESAEAEEELLEPVEPEPEREQEVEAEEPANYPRPVQQNFLSSCLATSGSNFAGCECSLEAFEARYSLADLQRAEANLASGELRRMVEYAEAACG